MQLSNIKIYHICISNSLIYTDILNLELIDPQSQVQDRVLYFESISCFLFKDLPLIKGFTFKMASNVSTTDLTILIVPGYALECVWNRSQNITTSYIFISYINIFILQWISKLIDLFYTLFYAYLRVHKWQLWPKQSFHALLNTSLICRAGHLRYFLFF